MALAGFVSAALTSLKNNLRRSRKGMDEPKVHIVPTEYDFPKVSAEKRKEVVTEILAKRKIQSRIVAFVYLFFTAAILLFLIVFVFGRLLFS